MKKGQLPPAKGGRIKALDGDDSAGIVEKEVVTEFLK
jgi:hypothetical protein